MMFLFCPYFVVYLYYYGMENTKIQHVNLHLVLQQKATLPDICQSRFQTGDPV